MPFDESTHASERFRKRVLIASAVVLFVLVWARELLRVPQALALVIGVGIVSAAAFTLAVAHSERRRARRRKPANPRRENGVGGRRRLAAAFLAGVFLPPMLTQLLFALAFRGVLVWRSPPGFLLYQVIAWGPIVLGVLLILLWPRRRPNAPRRPSRVRVRRKHAGR